MTDIKHICDVLKGKVRGNPVAISYFETDIPESYQGVRVDPCGIIRSAMDDDLCAYTSLEVSDCSHGSFITGMDNGNEQIRSGHILTDYIPAYNIDAAHAVNSGKFILPQGTVKGIGAAPLDKVPEGTDIKWIVLVCTPQVASLVSAARSVQDGVMPSAAAGNSFCTDAFVSPWFESNVVMTPGDYGGRMNNKLKPEELFVIIPIEYADNLTKILDSTPDVQGIYEATRPEDSPYWARQKAKAERSASNQSFKGLSLAKQNKLTISMDWDKEALVQILKAPRFVRGFAVSNMEDYAADKGAECITVELIEAQMEESGTGRFSKGGDGNPSFIGKITSLFKRTPDND